MLGDHLDLFGARAILREELEGVKTRRERWAVKFLPGLLRALSEFIELERECPRIRGLTAQPSYRLAVRVERRIRAAENLGSGLPDQWEHRKRDEASAELDAAVGAHSDQQASGLAVMVTQRLEKDPGLSSRTVFAKPQNAQGTSPCVDSASSYRAGGANQYRPTAVNAAIGA